MKIISYQVLAQIFGALAICASLLFVGYEIKQSRDIAIADIYQQRAALWKDIEMGLYSPEQFESAYKKIWAENVTLTRFDMFVLSNAASVRFNYYENVHFQNQLGMIGEEEWNTTKLNIPLEFYFPCSASYWERARGFWRPSFAAEVDKLIPKTGIPPCRYSPATNKGGGPFMAHCGPQSEPECESLKGRFVLGAAVHGIENSG